MQRLMQRADDEVLLPVSAMIRALTLAFLAGRGGCLQSPRGLGPLVPKRIMIPSKRNRSTHRILDSLGAFWPVHRVLCRNYCNDRKWWQVNFFNSSFASSESRFVESWWLCGLSPQLSLVPPSGARDSSPRVQEWVSNALKT